MEKIDREREAWGQHWFCMQLHTHVLTKMHKYALYTCVQKLYRYAGVHSCTTWQYVVNVMGTCLYVLIFVSLGISLMTVPSPPAQTWSVWAHCFDHSSATKFDLGTVV